MIRKAGPPGASTLRSIAQPTGGARGDARTEVAPDVYARGAALDFSRARPASGDEARRAKAKLLLEALRGEGDGLTFGSRVKNDLDAVQSLRNYYRALEVAGRRAPGCLALTSAAVA